ncbi:hypothetical protein ACFL20_13090 [Spirochaetota bacterium]
MFILLNNLSMTLTPGMRRFVKYTDFISDWQNVQSWGFDFETLQCAYDVGDYSIPVREALFKSLKRIASSKSKSIRDRHFTVWMGDYGSENRYFWVAVPSWMYQRVEKIFDKYFESLEGFMFRGGGRIPYLPFIPIYRYEYGRVIEYTYDDSEAGKMKIDEGEEGFGSGLTVVYRNYESAEGFDMRQKYCGRIKRKNKHFVIPSKDAFILNFARSLCRL